MLGSPLGNILGRPLGYPPGEAMGSAADFLDKFPGMARMGGRLDSRSFLDSRSSSPVDSETSGFSSGSDHLSDLLVSGVHVLSLIRMSMLGFLLISLVLNGSMNKESWIDLLVNG